ncbi:U1 small nuclear ribonucleoprotein 70 kDa-like [Manihot esculenta]|uniref:U1 small nuclear ribonucleoprotein 70 kDa-like n=1 Tax=Manihot esculenta TaxID=3983 RepID=UPI001CC3D665|nr:U1 small nuclear ribonucleoprotein 70 kDa-like [Manihot esculenta]
MRRIKRGGTAPRCAEVGETKKNEDRQKRTNEQEDRATRRKDRRGRESRSDGAAREGEKALGREAKRGPGPTRRIKRGGTAPRCAEVGEAKKNEDHQKRTNEQEDRATRQKDRRGRESRSDGAAREGEKALGREAKRGPGPTRRIKRGGTAPRCAEVGEAKKNEDRQKRMNEQEDRATRRKDRRGRESRSDGAAREGEKALGREAKRGQGKARYGHGAHALDGVGRDGAAPRRGGGSVCVI